MDRSECLCLLTAVIQLNSCMTFLRFMKECKQAGKQLIVWTVNRPEHMMEVCMSQRRLGNSADYGISGSEMGS
jgi:hypothetical protein